MALDTEKLSKLLALASSDNPHEATNALRMAQTLLKKEGMDFRDIASQIATPKPTVYPDFSDYQAYSKPEPKRYTDSSGCTWASKKEYDDYKKKQRERYETQRKRYALEREAIIRKYGSVKRAWARNEKEQILHDAVAQWLVPAENTTPKDRWSESLDGWTSFASLEKAPERVVNAIRSAIPMPTTIADAASELREWEARDREIELAIEDYDRNGGLDLPAMLRTDILRHEIMSGIHASNLDEILSRLRFGIENDCSYRLGDIANTLIIDLERIREVGTNFASTSSVQNGYLSTASERRAKIMEILSNLDTASLPDRTIAKMANVSPTTVGNIRKKMAQCELAL